MSDNQNQPEGWTGRDHSLIRPSFEVFLLIAKQSIAFKNSRQQATPYSPTIQDQWTHP